MSEKIRIRKVCPICRNKPACELFKEYGSLIFICEQFEPLEGAESGTTDRALTALEELKIREILARKEVQMQMGLCSNCENFSSCTFIKPEGGIWHCEEYR